MLKTPFSRLALAVARHRNTKKSDCENAGGANNKKAGHTYGQPTSFRELSVGGGGGRISDFKGGDRHSPFRRDAQMTANGCSGCG